MTAAAPIDPERFKEYAKLVFGALGGAMTSAMIYLGDRMGLYHALAGAGATSSTELAKRTGLDERWLREWLHQQGAAGVLLHRGEGRFELPPEGVAVLAEESHPANGVGFFSQIPQMMAIAERLPESFQSGVGLPYDAMGSEGARGIERGLAPWFRALLVPLALPRVPGVVAMLEAGIDVADVGCGAGVALLTMAKAYPRSRFHGYEISQHALERAEANRVDSGVANTTFHDAAKDPLPADGRFAFITTFDCLHDMTDPGGVIRQIRRAIRDDGTWFVADIKALPSYEQNVAKNPMAAMMYGTSVLTCMSSALSEPGGLGLGTLGLHTDLARKLAEDAGFTRFEALELGHPVNAFYVVRPWPMKTVLITGTSSGFGLHATVEAARHGWQVFATMRNPGKRAPLDAALSAAGVAERVAVSRLDVTQPASIAECVGAILQRTGGRLDAVVQNAGVAVGGAFEDVPEAEARRVLETNFWGVLGLTRALLPTFRAQRSGRIVVVSSNSAYAGEPANAIYVASKWAIEGWAESLMYEITPFGIELVLVEPGSYKTEIWGSSPRVLPEGSPYRALMQHLEKAIDEKVLASARDPREVAAVIARALEAKRPRFRYPVGPDAWIGHIARGKLPSRLQRFAITRLLGLHRV